MIWRLVRLMHLTLAARRRLFVLIGTPGLAPMLLPAGITVTVAVPHGLLLLFLTSGSGDNGYCFDTRLARFIYPSFAITAAALALIGCKRPSRPILKCSE